MNPQGDFEAILQAIDPSIKFVDVTPCKHEFREVTHAFEKGRSYRLSRCTLCGLYEKVVTRAGKIKSVYFSTPK